MFFYKIFLMKFNSLIPELSVSSIETSKDFYVNKLGFKIEYERKDRCGVRMYEQFWDKPVIED